MKKTNKLFNNFLIIKNYTFLFKIVFVSKGILFKFFAIFNSLVGEIICIID